MGHLCPLGALCCTYAEVTFRKYFHKAFHLKCSKHADGDNHTCYHSRPGQNQDKADREQSEDVRRPVLPPLLHSSVCTHTQKCW